jgi:hypothetical protein
MTEAERQKARVKGLRKSARIIHKAMKTGHFHSPPKGGKVYDRKNDQKQVKNDQKRGENDEY